MEIKTSELSGAALDWATGKAAGVTVAHQPDGPVYVAGPGIDWQPSKDWGLCGPIIEDMKVEVSPLMRGAWLAKVYEPITGKQPSTGDSPLIAACRAIVSAKLGDTVTVPDELEG